MQVARPKIRESARAYRVRTGSTRKTFREAGRMVDVALLLLIARLQRKWGYCIASEAGLRKMLTEDTGLDVGVDTIPSALERLEREGLVQMRWLRPGGLLPDDRPCTYGTRLIWVPHTRAQRRAIRARARHLRRRDGVTGGRGRRRGLLTVKGAASSVFVAVPSESDRASALRLERARQVDELERAAVDWHEADRRGRPPD